MKDCFTGSSSASTPWPPSAAPVLLHSHPGELPTSHHQPRVHSPIPGKDFVSRSLMHSPSKDDTAIGCVVFVGESAQNFDQDNSLRELCNNCYIFHRLYSTWDGEGATLPN